MESPFSAWHSRGNPGICSSSTSLLPSLHLADRFWKAAKVIYSGASREAAPLLPTWGASPQQPQVFKLHKQLWKDCIKPVVLKVQSASQVWGRPLKSTKCRSPTLEINSVGLGWTLKQSLRCERCWFRITLWESFVKLSPCLHKTEVFPYTNDWEYGWCHHVTYFRQVLYYLVI